MKNTGYVIVYTTFPQDYDIEQLCRLLLDKKLVACIQASPIVSFYNWQGATQSEKELRLALKTSADLLPQLEKYIADNHPYDVPQIIAVPIISANILYENWLSDCLTGLQT